MFIQGLANEWKSISVLLKSHGNCDYYSLYVLMNMLKAHENDVKEITEEKEKGNTTYFGSI